MKLNDLHTTILQAQEYYETNNDYLGNYLDSLGDILQYEGRYSEDEVYAILDREHTIETDYSYMADDAITVIPVGEIHHDIETDYTIAQYEAIEDKLDCVSSFTNGIITCYLCVGMNIRVY